MTLGKSPKLSEPQFSHLQNRDPNDCVHLQNCCENKYVLIPKTLRVVPDYEQCVLAIITIIVIVIIKT